MQNTDFASMGLTFWLSPPRGRRGEGEAGQLGNFGSALAGGVTETALHIARLLSLKTAGND